MLRKTFCHVRGIGPVRERRLWEAGLRDWEDLLQESPGLDLSDSHLESLRAALTESKAALEAGDAEYFAARLPRSEMWRLYPDFSQSMACIDIETTGRGGGLDHITSVALFDGREARTYVHGRDLERFADDIRACKLLVTFNGSCFDLPILGRELQIRLPAAHIDLRFLLRSLGYRGGLKRLERAFGLDRGGLAEADGFAAVLLWEAFERSGDERVLETLLAYNVEDVLSLETLLVEACRLKCDQLPVDPGVLPEPRLGDNPHRADPEILEGVLGGEWSRPAGRSVHDPLWL